MNPLFIIENNIVKGQRLPPLASDIRLNEVLLETFKKHPDFIGLIDAQTEETWTYKKLTDTSIRCALWLKKQGIKAGDVVSICSYNIITEMAPFCASLFLGVNLNPWYPDFSDVLESIGFYVKQTKPKIIFADEEAAIKIKEFVEQENINLKIIVFGNVSGFDSFDDIIKEMSEEKIDNFHCYPVEHDDNALILFSSGSGGSPKAIQHSYRSLHYNSYRFNKKFEFGKTCVTMQTSQLNWISSVLNGLRSLLNIYPLVLINNKTPEEICIAIQKYKIQWVFLNISPLNEIYKSRLLDKYDLSTIEEILTGGSYLHPDVETYINSNLKNGEVLHGYGITEIGTIATVQNKGNNNYESCGVICYDLDLKIIDVHTKKILGPNETGEIYFKQEYMMKYYLNNPKATKEAIDENGWLHSGDMGYYDESGNIYLVNRVKDLIIYRDINICPIEIENVLLKHPKVLEVAVVPIPHSVDTEHPMAFISTLDNFKIPEDELLKMTSFLSDCKKLRGGIKFLEKLPKTATGKIDKMKLKEMAKVYAK
ncbi:luciferin 4-monooxygenase-like isoform X2 [Leptopilina boulardi]|nr:luciferin 4-monooxygenase-like isoform X2 [Leptopilina boulardi]XP_051157896.1 luciferin 4-monooxygenase-like isoform X2 [Leptopilina boulardi]XP_051157897.1 luciferin 4-monooxygenase-like isoform X2 [Leptopilina boulardi]XP_051157898.1 luciferin 4-monooxygenase-like isoform X2 [Leptopilina boulardi]